VDGYDITLPACFDFGPGLIKNFLASRHDGHISTRFNETFGNSAPDAETAAGDKRAAPVHAELHVLHLSLLV
jgi:hypothetical protein